MRGFWRLLKLLNRPCSDISLLVSESLERHLAWPDRWAVRIHTCYCKACRRYRRQILQIRREIAGLTEEAPEASATPAMPHEARERIRRILNESRPLLPKD